MGDHDGVARALSDPSRKIATAYGVVDQDQPYASRWTFFIGLDGRILYIDKLVSLATHGRDVAQKLAELGIPKRRSGSADLRDAILASPASPVVPVPR
jgi:peroxiredoxin Q/BCP